MRQATRRRNGATNGDGNKLAPQDRPAHDWFRFVLSYPTHLVREYLEKFGIGKTQCVLDPFCGTGTTLVECKKCEVASVGVEANPMAHFASQVKLDWSISGSGLLRHASAAAEQAWEILRCEGIADDPFNAQELPFFQQADGSPCQEGECSDNFAREDETPDKPFHRPASAAQDVALD